MQIRQRLDSIHSHPDFELVATVIDRLAREGARTLLAGGGVRDALLGVNPKDLDLATSATPDRVVALFPKTVDVGRDFGTIVVVDGGRNLEVTTFRREDAYLDGRRPSSVAFTDEREDATRRDFTVNALFYDPVREEILDYIGGVEDLRNGRLRTVGDPRLRFAEDRLRMLRAVRFVAQLGFALDEDTAAAIRGEHGHLRTVAAERVLAEMKRLLSSPHRAAGLAAARETGVLDVVWPECDLGAANGVYASWENAFTAMTWSAGREASDSRLKQWKASRESRRRVSEQRRAVECLADPKSSRSDRVRAIGTWTADVLALAQLVVDPSRLLRAREEFEAVAPSGVLPEPFLTGFDLAGLGVPRTERMGQVLRSLYDAQLAGEITSRDEAVARVNRIPTE